MSEDQDPVCHDPLGENYIEGRMILALLVACEEFGAKKVLASGKVRLENYWVELEEDEQYYVITFHVKRLESERTAYGGHFTLGATIQHKIDKSNLVPLPPRLFR